MPNDKRKSLDPKRRLKAEKWAWLFCYDVGLLNGSLFGGLWGKYLQPGGKIERFNRRTTRHVLFVRTTSGGRRMTSAAAIIGGCFST